MKLAPSHLVAALSGALGLAAVQSSLTATTPESATVLKLANIEMRFDTLVDGGVAIPYRACGYRHQKVDGGIGERLDEPCWRGEFSSVPAFTQTVLDDGLKASRTP